MTKRILALITVFMFGMAAVAAGPFKWVHVGGDPCNPKAGCTLTWALGKAGWPADVQKGLTLKVKGETPKAITITSGLGPSKGEPWRGWMTWGKWKPKFQADTIAAWPDGKHEPASLWTFHAGDTDYHLIKVRRCGNWGGWTEVRPTVARTSTTPLTAKVETPKSKVQPPEDEMPLGVVPVVVCID